jgi:NADPH:quinone reductase-like Zn-dependent oxidoreductase
MILRILGSVLKAYLLRSYGDPGVLRIENMDPPKPWRGEVVVRILETSVNRADILIRSGHPEYRVRLPHILGGDVYGVVEALGEGVEDFEVGDRVLANFIYGCGSCSYCSIGLENLCRSRYIIGHNRWGSYAEYISLPARALIRADGLPESIGLGSLPLALVTAWRSLVTLSRIRPGSRVFIWGASGGVGTYAIQIAKYYRAEVVATTSSDEKAKRLRSLGADHVVNYREENLLSRVLEITGGEGVDVVLNTIGGDTVAVSIEMLKPGGVLIVDGVLAGSEARFGLRRAYLKGIVITGTPGGNKWELREALELVRRGYVKPIILRSYAFEDIPEAHRTMESGDFLGKLHIYVGRK